MVNVDIVKDRIRRGGDYCSFTAATECTNMG